MRAKYRTEKSKILSQKPVEILNFHWILSFGAYDRTEERVFKRLSPTRHTKFSYAVVIALMDFLIKENDSDVCS